VTGVILSSGFARAGGGVTSAASPLPASGCAPLGGLSGTAQIKSPAKTEKVQRKKVERPHLKLRNVEYRAFPAAAIRAMITSSFSIAAIRTTIRHAEWSVLLNVHFEQDDRSMVGRALGSMPRRL
jgi:hypothetical protein